MYWDTEAYAEGICDAAAGSSIQTLLDELRFIRDDIIDDAIQYRRNDDVNSEDGIDDNETAERYRQTGERIHELIEEITERERALEEEDGDDRYSIGLHGNQWEILDSGASYESGPRLFDDYDEAWEEVARLNATE